MIISRTPIRISFVGGGSDIPVFYREFGGAVVATAINKYIYITVNKQFDGRIIVQYSQTEVVRSVSQIQNNLIREGMKMSGVTGGIHITSISDIPAEGTGMGSSSSYIVGLLNALYAYQGKTVSAEALARQACQIEIDILKKPIGKQDQYLAAYGGFEYAQFNPDESVFIDPIISLQKTKESLEKNLLLFYTGITRSANPILAKQTQNLTKSIEKQNTTKKMVTLAKDMKEALEKNNIDSFGELLHENWVLKKKMAEGVSNEKIDKWYAKARKNGAIGGKILGAGGGGFLLLYAKQKNHKQIVKALSDLTLLPFQFEPQGSKIIFVGN